MTFDVNDRVRVTTGTYSGEVGRIVVRKPISVKIREFERLGFVYEVDFESQHKGRGYRVQFLPEHLERI